MDKKIDKDSLKARRGQIETSLDRFCKFISEKVNNTSIIEIQTRLERIQFQFQEFDIVQSNLEILDELEFNVREPIEEKFFKNISKAKILIADGKAPLSQVSVQGPSNNFARLHPIELPTFAESYEKWKLS